MLETSARLLQLLSLLQVHREWTGGALAERMEVTERTVRRDIGKLRSLGYPISASPGVAGGYQLGAGARLPPLLLDDGEALAVALGLATVASGPVAGIGESSVRALAKLEQVLPPRLRPRFSALKGSVSTLPTPASPVDPDYLTAVSGAISERRAIGFTYSKSEGAPERRIVEPYHLVNTGRRWYLVAWDTMRQDWRTFRVDRINSAPTERHKYLPRPLPADNVVDYVQQSITRSPYRYDVVVRLHAPMAHVAEYIGPSLAQLTPDGPGHTILKAGWDSLDYALMHLSILDVDFDVLEPAELRDRARQMAERLARSGSGEAD
ncbi:helix-turn-helix transcriptional regulator [Arthrobacter castelli]|uniref:helix-turn-helix transcriptional regulator n=1 Tax=Arthrobacter castelli TaxID=271431 RepID=UPI00040AE5A9|nr:YafY family protein [Arthrobacter castelli]